MKEFDCVEVIVEKEKYARDGVHKGMQGWICWNESIDASWLVSFPQYGEKPKERYKPWEYTHDTVTDEYICPQGGRLRHTTTDKDGKRTYRSKPKDCKNCPCKAKCGANEKGQKMLTTHICRSIWILWSS